MLDETTNPGLIPDFFHDVIAFFVPGFSLLILIWANSLLLLGSTYVPTNISLGTFFFASIAAYVIGRILGHAGWLLQHRKFHDLLQETPGPKWSLIFDENDTNYTQVFKKNLITKIENLLKKQKGKELIKECKKKEKDDYFNLIQYYLRERFPSVALFEKKQNANITLMRSLSMAFALNILLYTLQLFLFFESDQIVFSGTALTWLLICLLCSIVAYKRFRLDQNYHAMYVFESFIATRKLLLEKNDKSKATSESSQESH